tara:strand:+ start:1615 stop:2292 length:678 start_codon:yes stop_codon:yes gene_type:complete
MTQTIVEPTRFSRTDLEYLKDVSPYGVEAAIIYMMLQEVPKTYIPGKKVLAMSIGPGNLTKEGKLIRDFHRLSRGIVGENITVLSCDTYSRIIDQPEDRFDFEIRGPDRGDANTHIPWLRGLAIAEEKKTSYDHIHISNPDFSLQFKTWKSIFEMALYYLSDQGIITSISLRPTDRGHLKNLCSHLIQKGLSETTICRRYKYFFDERNYFDYSIAVIQRKITSNP